VPQSGLTVTSTLNPSTTQQGVHMGIHPAPYQTSSGITIVAATGGTPFLDFKTGTAPLDFDARLIYIDADDELRVDGVANFNVNKLKIRGGSDLVEGFDSQTDDIEPGTLMVIDPDHAGELMPSNGAYDSKVAGIVSGAIGVESGLHMGQEGVMDGKHAIAMTGRVYVKCTTENGVIRPGDRLTTSSTAGHTMKATDTERCDGAVIGKAMSSLDEEAGMVLVLVNLQ
jgi:hypothetical protein